MVIEHTFVTTLEQADAMRAAASFLGQHGFESVNGAAFPVGDPAWTSLEMRRGKKTAQRAKTIVELPQMVRVDFDRGRVSVAVSITANHIWGGSSWTNVGFGLNASEVPKKMALHQALLMAIVTGLEQVLAQRQEPTAAAAAWVGAEAACLAAARRRNRHLWFAAGIIFALLALVIGLVIWGSTR